VIALKPLIVTAVLLLAASSVSLASAAERYTEVWNPPEAQSLKSKPKTHPVVPVQAKKKHKSVTSVKKVAERAALAQPSPAPRTKAPARQPEPVMQVPRKIEPNGQVMRV
jgi:hypothetical protein